MDEYGKLCSEFQGSVQIQYKAGSGDFVIAIIRAIPNYGTILYLDWKQTRALLRVCEYVFCDPSSSKLENPPEHLWTETGFNFMAPLPDKKELFWFSFGSLTCYVPTKRMKVVFQDLKTAFDRLGGFERFIPTCIN